MGLFYFSFSSFSSKLLVGPLHWVVWRLCLLSGLALAGCYWTRCKRAPLLRLCETPILGCSRNWIVFLVMKVKGIDLPIKDAQASLENLINYTSKMKWSCNPSWNSCPSNRWWWLKRNWSCLLDRPTTLLDLLFLLPAWHQTIQQQQVVEQDQIWWGAAGNGETMSHPTQRSRCGDRIPWKPNINTQQQQLDLFRFLCTSRCGQCDTCWPLETFVCGHHRTKHSPLIVHAFIQPWGTPKVSAGTNVCTHKLFIHLWNSHFSWLTKQSFIRKRKATHVSFFDMLPCGHINNRREASSNYISQIEIQF